MQSSTTVFLVRPVRFGFNPETAASNHFQHSMAGLDAAAVQARAFAEFDALVASLRAKGVTVWVFDDTPEPVKPDAVFPNNWLTLHPDGRVLLYPMCAPNRRPERRPDILEALRQQFAVKEVVDLSFYELEDRFLEGTGSILFDHEHRVAYACLSPRTDAGLFADVAAQLGYRPVTFRACDANGQEIYHTNVMLSIGAGFAVVCLESIVDAAERAAVVASFAATNHEIVDISLAQVAQFAGNLLALQPTQGPALLAMSQSAFDALTPAQRRTLGTYCELLPLPIPTIETIGGGSVRCMLAEVFLPAIPAESTNRKQP
ncbi:arginine deiminase-related protein [Hymenobacter tibetensis]|uniref:Arginine deiminase-related protein n=1 Tax=Hymenobacter tibetensis TaxID=497967 RepID=A0ABY4D1X6_9BACT|nr:arginine deiminase-related protein [Hymenobacter tibetensis]UOG76533.1 arginine deiminase-related protein [Hymenobacter tibetensis]